MFFIASFYYTISQLQDYKYNLRSLKSYSRVELDLFMLSSGLGIATNLP
jgi:hypothetical protein